MISNLLVIYLILVGILTLARAPFSVWKRGVVKMTAASLFLYVSISGDTEMNAFEWWFFGGLAASWLGDLCLLSEGTGRQFKFGILSFLIAHIAYGIAFLFVELDVTIAGVLLGLFSGVGFTVYNRLKLAIGDSLRVPVQVYIVALCAMTALAWSVQPPHSSLAFGLAATAFLVSDISVALQRFGPHSAIHRLWGVPLYFGAQMSFAILISKDFS